MLESEQLPPIYTSARVPLEIINVFAQPRKTFEEEKIRILALDIARRRGLINPLSVARFDELNCKNYLDYLNGVRKTDYEVGNLTYTNENGSRYYHVLIDGERRFRACQLLQTAGCSQCQEQSGLGNCYEKHIGDNLVDVRFSINISPDEAIDRQYSANIHENVPLYEEARDLAELLTFRRAVNPKYSLAQFGRDVGRSPQAIREAAKFCLLPVDIQQLVREKKIAYGIACEITRLQDQGLTSDQLMDWAIRGIIGRFKVPDFRQKVDNYIFEKTHNQLSLFDIFTENERKEMERSNRRIAVGGRMMKEAHEVAAGWQAILALIEKGYLEDEVLPFASTESAYALGSPARVYQKLIELEERILPYLRGELTRRNIEAAQQIILETQQTMRLLPTKSP